MKTTATTSDRKELRGLIWQFASLSTVVLGIAVLKIVTDTDADRGLMSCIGIIAIGLTTVTGVQIKGMIRRIRTSARPARVVIDEAIPPQASAGSAKKLEPPTVIRCASTAHVVGETVSITSQYREIVEHDARTPALPRAPKAPTMVYCPR